MKIYSALPCSYLTGVGMDLQEGLDLPEGAELQETVRQAMVSARFREQEEPLRLALAHLLCKPDFNLDSFFLFGLWEQDDTELREFLSKIYRLAWPDAEWPPQWEDYSHVEIVGAPGPTWSSYLNRWGPDAPPSPAERKRNSKT